MNYDSSCPLTYAQIVDAYFLEHRAKVIDIAAFLDRLERAADGPAARDDFRVAALRNTGYFHVTHSGSSARSTKRNSAIAIATTMAMPTPHRNPHAASDIVTRA